jgi:YHS domain-containing protein
MKGLFGLVVLMGVMLVSTACGGGKASEPPPTAPSGDAAIKAPGDAKLGDTTRCPVSGDEFVVDVQSPKSDYQGSTYYFCSANCKRKFDATPEKFAAPPSPPAKPAK